MQYLRGKMMAVTSAARKELEKMKGMAAMQPQQPQQQQPSMAVMPQQQQLLLQQQPQPQPQQQLQQQQQQPVIDRSQIFSDLQKRKTALLEENSEVKRIKINPTETKLQMENIVDEEWKRMTHGIEKQTQAVHLKALEVSETKVDEFAGAGALKRTFINKPLSESKPAGMSTGNVSSTKTVTEFQQKKVTLSDSASRAKQDHAPEKLHDKRRRWDDLEASGKGRKYDDVDKRRYDDDKRSHRKRSRSPPASYRSTRSPPRSNPVRPGRNVLSLKDDKVQKFSSAGQDTGRKAATLPQSKDMIIVDDDKPKQQNPAVKAVEKPLAWKPSGSTQSTTMTTTTTTTAAATTTSFKFGWKSKTVRPQLLVKPSVQSGPMPGRKNPAKGMTTSCVHFNCKLPTTVKVKKADAALHGNPISELRDVTCHMGSHSVTCHPT